MKNEPVVPFGWCWFESEENKSPYTLITGYTYERFSTMKPDGSAKIDEGSLIPLYTHPAELTDEEINVVAILQDAEIVPVGHEIWKTGEEFNKYKRIVLATAKALRKAQE